jgi:tetratricopeptide (TPR) repeat protein
MRETEANRSKPDGRLVAVLLAMTASVWAAPTMAQTPQQMNWCIGGANATPDLQIKGCTAVIATGPIAGNNLAKAYYNRGIAYAGKGEYDSAIADYDQTIRLSPKNANAFYNRGSAYAKKRQYDQAIADYDRAIQLDPKNAFTYVSRGNAYLNKDQSDPAIADYSQAIRLDPTNADYLSNRCLARAVAGRELAQALADCNASLRLAPDDGNTLDNRALVQFKLGAFAQAIVDYDAAIKHDPKDAISLYGRGIAKLKTDDTMGGNSDLAAAKAIRADVADVYADYGVK